MRNPDERDAEVRRLLEAAAARPGEADATSRFLLTRIRTEAASRRAALESHSFGTAALRLLPALAILVVAVAGWTSFESARAARSREAAAAELTSSSGDEILLVAALLEREEQE